MKRFSIAKDETDFSKDGQLSWQSDRLKPYASLVQFQYRPLCRCSTMASMSAFQAEDTGSIPVTGLLKKRRKRI